MSEPLSPRDLLEKLVSFPTVSRDSNLALVDWVEGYLNDHGIACHRDYDPTGQKASLYAHVGPEVEGGVVQSCLHGCLLGVGLLNEAQLRRYCRLD